MAVSKLHDWSLCKFSKFDSAQSLPASMHIGDETFTQLSQADRNRDGQWRHYSAFTEGTVDIKVLIDESAGRAVAVLRVVRRHVVNRHHVVSYDEDELVGCVNTE
jgi:hypothetical protein